MDGHAKIYSFPYRIYSTNLMPKVSGTDPVTHNRVKVYPLFTARAGGSTLSPDVPFDSWPDFQWSPKVPKYERIDPVRALQSRPHIGIYSYDALRLDVLGVRSKEYAEQFIIKFMFWLRHLTNQNWIGYYEPQTDSAEKNYFDIDEQGRAISSIWTKSQVRTATIHMKGLDVSMYKKAFHCAIHGEEPLFYWMVWQDACLYNGTGRIREAILSLALSMEIARDTVFPRFAPTKNRPGYDNILLKPFDGTDLLAHFSEALEKHHSRNLETEQPQLWRLLNQIYIARHHVAHGRLPFVLEAGQSQRAVSDEDMNAWTGAVHDILLWVETL